MFKKNIDMIYQWNSENKYLIPNFIYFVFTDLSKMKDDRDVE